MTWRGAAARRSKHSTVWHLPTLAEVRVKGPPGSPGSCLMWQEDGRALRLLPGCAQLPGVQDGAERPHRCQTAHTGAGGRARGSTRRLHEAGPAGAQGARDTGRTHRHTRRATAPSCAGPLRHRKPEAAEGQGALTRLGVACGARLVRQSQRGWPASPSPSCSREGGGGPSAQEQV